VLPFCWEELAELKNWSRSGGPPGCGVKCLWEMISKVGGDNRKRAQVDVKATTRHNLDT
jgi:hypothetical protein